MATAPSNTQQNLPSPDRCGVPAGPRRQRADLRPVKQTRPAAPHKPTTVCFYWVLQKYKCTTKPLCNRRGGGEPGSIQVLPLSQADPQARGLPQKPLKKYSPNKTSGSLKERRTNLPGPCRSNTGEGREGKPNKSIQPASNLHPA